MRRVALILLAMAVWAGGAVAQETLGELLDLGGRKMSQAELVAALQGTVMSGDSVKLKGGGIRFEYSPDGTVTGVGRTATGEEFRHSGTWRVDENGHFVRETISMPSGVKKVEERFFFKRGDAYYAAESETDRAAPVFKRLFEKK